MSENILVIVVDGLRASALGAYGNTSFATPMLDRLAAQSLLVEWCYAPSPELGDIYSALWQSNRTNSTSSQTTAPKLFADAGYRTTIVTDDPKLRAFTAAAEFQEIVEVEAALALSPDSRPSHDVLTTNLARTFSAAIETITDAPRDQPQLVWLHTLGMYGPWDAPLELQHALLDEEDPEPVDSTIPPDLVIGPGDPDAAFRYASAYAAQVMVLDQCLESLLDAVRWGDGWTIALVGARGFPLGEHGRIGGVDPRTYVEQMQTPWLLSLPDGLGRMSRASLLASHCDLLPTLADRIGRHNAQDQPEFHGSSILPAATSPRPTWRESIISESQSARSIRTASWCAREELTRSAADAPVDDSTTELYVRPDDRWEANDVAKLCPDVVDELQSALRRC